MNTSLNKRASSVSRAKKVLNEEGMERYEDRKDRSLLLQSLALKLAHTFYKEPDAILKSFEKTVNDNLKDPEFLKAVIFYAKNLGMRLSPSLALAILDREREDIPEKLITYVYTRPDFIANALAYLKMTDGDFDLSEEYRDGLRKALENMSEITLKRKMMRRRTFKLSDLIKIFRPTPKNAKMSELYKGIIENKVRLTKEESVTTLLSDTTLSKEEKVDEMKKNVKNISINSLTRNLSQFTGSVDDKTKNNLMKRYTNIDIKNVMQINPFDLIISQENFDYALSEVLDAALKKWAEATILPDLGRVGFLIDVSGSMGGSYQEADDGFSKAFKYLALLSPLYKPEFVWFFSNDIQQYPTYEKMIIQKSNPNEIFAVGRSMRSRVQWGGTALHLSIMKTMERNQEKIDTLFVITDEYGNIEQNVDEFNKMAKTAGIKLIVINIAYTGETNINPMEHSTKWAILIGGLNAKIFDYLNLYMDFDKFKKTLISKYQEWLNQ